MKNGKFGWLRWMADYYWRGTICVIGNDVVAKNVVVTMNLIFFQFFILVFSFYKNFSLLHSIFSYFFKYNTSFDVYKFFNKIFVAAIINSWNCIVINSIILNIKYIYICIGFIRRIIKSPFSFHSFILF